MPFCATAALSEAIVAAIESSVFFMLCVFVKQNVIYLRANLENLLLFTKGNLKKVYKNEFLLSITDIFLYGCYLSCRP